MNALLNWVNGKKKSPTAQKTHQPTGKVNQLFIEFKDGSTLLFQVRNYKGTERVLPWKDFYKWYFGRKSDSYIYFAANNSTMFRRKDIMRFTVSIVDE